jgi:hypothetical protein
MAPVNPTRGLRNEDGSPQGPLGAALDKMKEIE